MKAKLNWTHDLNFKCENETSTTFIDASIDDGGEHNAPTPKELLLNAMLGCTAIDTKMTLNKMRQSVDAMNLEISAKQTKSYPIHFKSVHITFDLQGEIIEDKLIFAISKSLSKYCGINYMISKSCKITYEIFLNEKKIYHAAADFQSSKDEA